MGHRQLTCSASIKGIQRNSRELCDQRIKEKACRICKGVKGVGASDYGNNRSVRWLCFGLGLGVNPI